MTISKAPSASNDGQGAPAAPMSLARFQTLTDAYGGSAARWPAAEREAARQLLEGQGLDAAAARQALTMASALDQMLARDTVPPVTEREVHAILATFGRRRRIAWTPMAGWRRARLAFMSSVMAVAGIAGVASGVVLTSIWFPANAATLVADEGHDAPAAAEPFYRDTVFGVPGSEWSEQ